MDDRKAIWKFFSDDAPIAINTAIGRQLGQAMVAEFKARFADREDGSLVGYLVNWNERHGEPFTREQLWELAQTPARPVRKRAKKPAPDKFAMRLLDDPNA
jgi:hypothetical protein